MSRAKLAKTPVIGASTPILMGLAGACALVGVGVTSIASSERPTTGIRRRRMVLSSGALERGQDVLAEQRDILLREVVRHAAELEESHDHAGPQFPHLRLDFARHVVGVADDREPLLLHEIEIHL